MKQYRLYILILAIALGLVVLAEVFRPTPVDWRESFSRNDKIPYGSWILYRQLDRLFPKQPVRSVDETIYQTLAAHTTAGENYLLINSEITLSETDSDELLRFVRDGGTVFMAAEKFRGPFTDSLGIETTPLLPFLTSDTRDSIHVNFSSPSLRAENDYVFPFSPADAVYFALFDEDSSVVLGTMMQQKKEDKNRGVPNFLKVRWGEGTFYLSTVPRAFSNYGILSKGGAEYVATALSWLPANPLLWDEYYKAGRAAGREQSESPMRYLLSQEPLRWAWFLLLAGGGLFVIFGARRRQRIIPVVEPPRNTTVEFVETVGTLYHQHGDFRNVADKMILYFLDYVRSRLNLSTSDMDDLFIRRVSERSGVDLEQVAELFSRITAITSRGDISKEELLELSDGIERFYRASQR